MKWIRGKVPILLHQSRIQLERSSASHLLVAVDVCVRVLDLNISGIPENPIKKGKTVGEKGT